MPSYVVEKVCFGTALGRDALTERLSREGKRLVFSRRVIYYPHLMAGQRCDVRMPRTHVKHYMYILVLPGRNVRYSVPARFCSWDVSPVTNI